MIETEGGQLEIPYPITLYNKKSGDPEAILWPDGKVTKWVESKVGKPCVAWNEITAKKEVIGEVVWDGCSPTTATSEKGELLGNYAEIKEMWRKLGVDGPGFKIASKFMRKHTFVEGEENNDKARTD
jgi:hypothetical protein